MLDLFGDSNTTPQCAGLKNRLLNAAHGFNEFWDAWPRNNRKVAKKQCLDKWARFECANEATLIVQHVEWMKGQPDWQKDAGAFIPAPMVYLNQRRWEGWEPPVERPKRPTALDEIKAHQGVAPSEEIRARLAELRRKG